MEGVFSTLFLILFAAFWAAIRKTVTHIVYNIVLRSIWQVLKWWAMIWVKAIHYFVPDYPRVTNIVGSVLAVAINPISISMVVYHWPKISLLIAGN
ncbi:hypothetical protein [Kiloniella majae]|uniref:hypothetical protein n=1 Tax=Kiloniella majae TaxID=1938558 RepID=UPI000A27761B|nr:hypothetical protein [Kiloniella majae]